MKSIDLKKIIDLLKNNYNNFDNDKIIAWSKEFVKYNYDDVMYKLNQIMSDEYYQRSLPTLNYILKGIQKCSEIENFDKRRVLCDICKRPFNSVEEMDNHFQRCCCISTIKREAKKYLNKEYNDYEIRELYQMNDEEFDEKYKKFAKLLMEKSDLDWQKKVMECIINPPKPEKAKSIIDGKLQ